MSRPDARSPSASCSPWDACSAKSQAQVGLAGRKVAAHVGATGQQAGGDQECPCSDWTPLDRAIRTGVRPKMPPRTAVPRAVPVVGLVARRALPNTTNSVLWVHPSLRCSRLGPAHSIFWPIVLKLKYVIALAPAVDVVASPAAELDSPCYPIRVPQIGSFYAPE